MSQGQVVMMPFLMGLLFTPSAHVGLARESLPPSLSIQEMKSDFHYRVLSMITSHGRI